MADKIKKNLKRNIEDAKMVALTDEQLDSISAGSWQYSDEVDISDLLDESFMDGAWVVWRAPGCHDCWCQVLDYDYVGDWFISFDLYNPADSNIYFDVPADQVLLDCIYF